MRFFRRKRCKIVYRSDILTSVHTRDAYAAFDTLRFKKIRDRLIKEKMISRKDILKAEKVSEEDLRTVHSKNYLDSLKNPAEVGKILNLDYFDLLDNHAYEYFKYLTEGTILATSYALEHKIPVFNLGGGYHHAHPDRGEGFCLLNDVAISIEKLRNNGKLKRVLVIDLDYHQGNGILLIYKDIPDIYTFSMHSENWAEIEKENNIDIELPSYIEDKQYLEILKENLPTVFINFSPDLVIYLAGSDPYIKDTLGDFNISETGMLERDIFVYQQVRERDIPLAVLAAGGYGTDCWKVYYNFIKWVIQKG